MEHPIRFPLNPHSSVQLPVTIHTYAPGPFRSEMLIFVRDANGYRTITVTAAGTSIGPPKTGPG